MSGSAAADRDPNRFAFGKNWAAFLERVDESTISRAVQSLMEMLEISDLSGKSFLDIGSGSGLFSLAAHRLGASVVSVDLDTDSVLCTEELRRRFGSSNRWSICSGSALDREMLQGLGLFDVVYSWGVLHHTGKMWDALQNAGDCVASGGTFFIAIYNDQGRTSRCWSAIKRLYNRLPSALRFLVLWPALLRIWGPTTVRDLLRGHVGQTWREYPQANRGMSAWRDVVDWVGGYPFEVAKPNEITEFFAERNFQLKMARTCGRGRGCNEFVFAAGK
jgi:2-polyprenyl-6-hydroxyphenyl methylase/3-demethylubiquinone-9 3-methyltransferase